MLNPTIVPFHNRPLSTTVPSGISQLKARARHFVVRPANSNIPVQLQTYMHLFEVRPIYAEHVTQIASTSSGVQNESASPYLCARTAPPLTTAATKIHAYCVMPFSLILHKVHIHRSYSLQHCSFSYIAKRWTLTDILIQHIVLMRPHDTNIRFYDWLNCKCSNESRYTLQTDYT